ncbi:TPR domain family protein [Desulfamplus magnetovallimortis]|uniref:TPR domain family protein n=1 Tax=Desulfamplus magnetovallimortis TaxID=1246637 RepID=A0A1W1H5F4_9BACT|nr:M48 family metallopeptidase [Desulfamplus magnetovallimortis]SLM27676.1 TPR domain family protein [Desulfamplus magnetovallimortis]
MDLLGISIKTMYFSGMTLRLFKLLRVLLSFLWVFIYVVIISAETADAISISKEKEIADEFMETIKKQGKIINDPISSALVSGIGKTIVSNLPPQPFAYSFYIMDEEQFNAFAGPGSNIFINRGLITSLDTVDELAGIIGHEIAHSSCRHISDMIDQSRVMSIGTLAGVLAGVLVGASAGGGTDLGQAVAIGSMAAGQTMMLSYSREHESEADQKGLAYIAASNFNPMGLLTGLEKIRNRDWYGSEHVPDYLKTHPGTTERIVNIQSWLERNSAPNENAISPVNSFRFEMVKSRLAAIYGDEYEMENRFLGILEKNPESAPAHYGMALLMERKNRVTESLEHLRHALSQRPFDPLILLETGKVNILSGNAEKALQVVQGLENISEIEMDVWYVKSEAQLLLGNFSVAEKGFEKVIANGSHRFPKAYYHMALIKDKKDAGPGKSDSISETPAISHYFLGLYYYEMKNMKNARFHLEKSIENLDDKEKRSEAEKILGKIIKQKKEG